MHYKLLENKPYRSILLINKIGTYQYKFADVLAIELAGAHPTGKKLQKS
jgi:hypothetical protein